MSARNKELSNHEYSGAFVVYFCFGVNRDWDRKLTEQLAVPKGNIFQVCRLC